MPELTGDGRTICGVIHSGGSDCNGPVMADAPLNLCSPHMVEAYLHIRDLLAARDGETFTYYGKTYDLSPRADTNFVYYVRREGLIKIGTSRNLWERMQKIQGRLLAIEPGDRETEQERHRQFAALRIGRKPEWFHDGPDLMAHIHALRQKYGDPVDRRYDPETGGARPLWRLLLDSTTVKR